MMRSPAELLAASAWKHHQAGDLDRAIELYRQAVAIKPDFAEVHNNLGNALRLAGRLEEALESLRRTAKLKPDVATLYTNLGLVLADLNRFEEAATNHRRALKLQPDLALAHNNLGIALVGLSRLDEAVASYRRALTLKPDFAEAQGNLGNALRKLGRLDEAVECYRRAIDAKPGFAQAVGQYVFLQRMLCDWREPEDPERLLVRAAQSGERAALAFTYLAIADDPVQQLQMGRHDTQAQVGPGRSRLVPQKTHAHERIRLAYLSADFCEHATAYLMAELFETHDRSKFEIHAISYGPDDASPMHRRLIAAFDHFIDVRDLSDLEAARRICDAEIDIAVDLKGHTRDSRPGILSYRPAPIQASYLGYPGSTGADFIDYILVDAFVVPSTQQASYTEKLVHLPDCYQVNDRRRPIAEELPSRADCGLPETGFVFCCFNNTYKIAPAGFDIWMRLVSGVPGSVLWLMGDNPWAEANLRREAGARDVDPDRLVFAPRLPLAAHLSRHRCADLFLDTLPCNAHTTASDALWAGLPVLTCAGRGFAARVAGSLLHAIGLPELVVHGLEEYEALALALAKRPSALADIKAKLARNRLNTPLFDTARFRRHVEAAYTEMWTIWRRGEKPRAFSVEPVKGSGS